ncbi:MAG: glycoside-pentoside-hexuronide (GPH):cation symporter [Eubacteriales bacterium]
MENLKTYIGKKEFNVFTVGALGQGMVYGLMSAYISDFYLNVLQVTPVFVLLLMFSARIYEAFMDPIMGMIADRLNMKRGKMRPYLLLTPIPIAILTTLLFVAPDISATAKMFYAAITYVLWGMIYTMSDVPFWSMPNLMTPDPDERGRIISISKTTNGVGSAIPMALFMLLSAVLPMFGLSGLVLEKTKYLTIVLIASIIGNLLFARVYFHAKERINIPHQKRQKGEAGSIKLLFNNKPLVLVLIMGILSCGRYMFQAGAIHVARYTFYIGPSLLGMTAAEKEHFLQENISKVSLVFSIATAVGMFGTIIVLPKLIKRFSYKSLVIVSCLMGFFSCMAIYFIGYDHFWACVPFLVISCIPAGVINVVASAMIGDALDYMEWKTGIRETGLGTACQTFVNKFGSALATSFIVLMYIMVNISGDLGKIGTAYTADPLMQTAEVRGGIFSIISIIPAISLLLCAVPIFFYDLTGKKKQIITEELQQQRAAKGISVE